MAEDLADLRLGLRGIGQGIDMVIQWYPGHMTKAKRMMEENIKLVDVVMELVDARVPLSSRNPVLMQLAKDKPRVVIMNKIDLADDVQTQRWAKVLKEEGAIVVTLNARDGKGVNLVLAAAKEACKDKIARNKARGLINRPIRAMVVGIPNVGKSTFINKIAGKASTKTGNKPGVTKGKQWIKLNKDLELLDTPGLLWPKFEDQTIGIRLALIGSIKEDILDTRALALEMIAFMQAHYSKQFVKKYLVEEIDQLEPIGVLEVITLQRNMLKTGSLPDIDRMAVMALDEFKNGKFGKVTLDYIEA